MVNCAIIKVPLRRSLRIHIQGANGYEEAEYASTHVETQFWSYLSKILMDFASISVILKVIKIWTKKPEKPELRRLGF